MKNVLELSYLIPLFPLIGFLITGLGRRYLSKPVTGIIGSGVILISFLLSVWIFFQVKEGNSGVVSYFNFISAGSLKIPFSFQIDALSSLFLLIITGVGFLIHVYSASYMHHESKEHFARYFSYLNLFVFSMLLLVMGGNFVILFIGWEGVGLCSYLLIGYWFKNTEYNYAARKAFVMNRIGDLAFLIAIFMIIAKVGSVNFSDVFSAEGLQKLSPSVTIITLLLFVGATGKSAQIPLYTWLPDAMAGPTPVSALIHAATMVTAGIYMIARSNILYSAAPLTMNIVAIIGAATALFAATIALRQNDIKKVLAYSTVSQLGYMFLALGSGAYSSGIFHMATHAFFKALLFLGSGSVIHAMHHAYHATHSHEDAQDMRNMGGLRRYMPWTFALMTIATLAIAGIPPLSGFFSKDEILAAAFARGADQPVFYLFYGLGVLAALLTAFYMARLMAMTFLGENRTGEQERAHLHEAPWIMTGPLVVL